MKIQRRETSDLLRTECIACAAYERPADLAFYAVFGEEAEYSWPDTFVCDACVAGGVDGIREALRKLAARARAIADDREALAEHGIEIDPGEVEALKEERAAREEAWQAGSASGPGWCSAF